MDPNMPQKKDPDARPFDLLSNKYHVKHDLRKQADEAEILKVCQDKFAATRDYDAVRVGESRI
jgi:hypothetical protein